MFDTKHHECRHWTVKVYRAVDEHGSLLDTEFFISFNKFHGRRRLRTLWAFLNWSEIVMADIEVNGNLITVEQIFVL